MNIEKMSIIQHKFGCGCSGQGSTGTINIFLSKVFFLGEIFSPVDIFSYSSFRLQQWQYVYTVLLNVPLPLMTMMGYDDDDGDDDGK